MKSYKVGELDALILNYLKEIDIEPREFESLVFEVSSIIKNLRVMIHRVIGEAIRDEYTEKLVREFDSKTGFKEKERVH